MTFIHVVGVLPVFLGVGVRVSLKAIVPEISDSIPRQISQPGYSYFCYDIAPWFGIS